MTWEDSSLAAHRTFFFLEENESENNNKAGEELDSKSNVLEGNIEFRNLIFFYPFKLSSSSSSSSTASSSSSTSSRRPSDSIIYPPVVREMSTNSPFAYLFPNAPSSLLNPSANLQQPLPSSSTASSTSPFPDQFRLEIDSLHIFRGQFVAIVGPSGSGKSTILNLLLRLYEPVEGIILFDGKDSRNINPECLRSHIG